MGELSKDDLLRSWKEIAAHLGVDVRTCHRWEDERGMPVHRAEAGERKSPVFAYKNELDAWFRGTFKSSHPSQAAPVRRGSVKWVWGGAAVLVLAGAFFGVRTLLVRRQPADFRIVGSFFVALDADERELWRKDMGVDDLRPEEFYRASFQVKRADMPSVLPLLAIRDIDGDSDIEVLFALARTTDREGEGTLFCWDRRGKERWKYRCDRELACPAKRFAPEYRIGGFHYHDLDGDGREEILVESIQASDWPCQLAVLDCWGKKTGEFWNAGYLRDFAYRDLDGDGRDELIVVGLNNEYRGGCLAVFDTRRISGGSPQSGEYACAGIEPGSMLYYLKTPYTDVARARKIVVSGLRRVDIMNNDWIEAEDFADFRYDFDFSLRCIQVSVGHSFQANHDELRRAGAIGSVLDDAYKARLVEDIRYWDGSAWTPEPTPVGR